MKLALSEDQIILRDSVRRFVERQLQAAIENSSRAPELLGTLRPELNELGLWGLTAPVDAGGFGQDTLTAALVVEELAKSEPSTAVLAALHLGLIAPTLASSSIAAAILEGTARVAVAIGEFIIAPADGSDSLLMLHREPAASARLAHGLALNTTSALGLEGIHFGAFNPGEVPDAESIEITPSQLEERLGRTSTLLGAAAIGLGRAALDEALSYAEERKQFGRSLNRFQAIQFKLADMGTALETTGWLLWRAAATENSALAGIAVEQAAQAAFFAADEALQIHGGYGYTQEYPVEGLFRHAQELRRLVDTWLSFASSSF